MIQPTTFIRSFPTVVTQASPRQLVGRLVPYDLAADVVDDSPDGLDIYSEGFRRGAFSRQALSTEPGVLGRIGLVHTHDGGLGYLGPFTALRDEQDGLWGEVAILRSKASDVEDLLASGISELSVEFRLPASGGHTVVDAAGVRWRTKAHLDRVALEAKGAYSGAAVAAFRSEMDELAKEQADAKAIEDAKLAEEAAAAEAILERKRRWEELTGDRLSKAMARQVEYATRYAPSRPPG